MNKLISANFMRLRKAKEFWVCAIATFLISVWVACTSIDTAKELIEDGMIAVDNFYFQLAPLLGVVLAVFISLFLGTETSEHTIRNKLIAGHTRTKIYLTNFLSVFCGAVFITVLWLIGGLPCIFLIGNFEMGLTGWLSYLLAAVGIAAAFSALFVYVGMNFDNKALAVVFALVLWVALLFAASGVNDRLCEPATNGGMAMIDGEFVFLEETPNPLYLSGNTRSFFEFIFYLLPTGQAIAMANVDITAPFRDFGISMAATLLLLLIGILIFRKKDLN